MRNQGKLRLGFFPLPLAEACRIRACLSYPASPFTAIDPCIGDGVAFSAITGEARARRYGVELDAYRAEQAAGVVDVVIHGDCLEVHCRVESFGLAFLNPPYDWIIGQSRSERTERVFLAPKEHKTVTFTVSPKQLALVDAKGKEMPMPSDFDSFTPAAALHYAGDDETVREDLTLLLHAMGAAGFEGMRSEWWHFVAPDWREFARVTPEQAKVFDGVAVKTP